MGWSGYYQTSRPDAVAQSLTGLTVERGAWVGSTYYAAVRMHQQNLTHALVVLVRGNRRTNEVATKTLPEFSGPVETACPASILALLTPMDDLAASGIFTPSDIEYATQWRTACRERLAQRDRSREVTPGTVIRFARAIRFSDGVYRNEFEYVRGSTFRSLAGVTLRLPGWRDRTDWVTV